MKMKKILIGLAVLALCWTAQGANSRVAFPVGEGKTVELSFAPKHYFVPEEGRNLVKVSLSGQRQVRFEGLSVGQTVVQFLDGEEVRDTVTVTVTSGLDELRYTLKRRIDDALSGASSVDVREEGNKLVLDGTIRSPGDWEMIDRILRMAAFSGKVENMLSYAVDDATITSLKRKLRNMGFEVTDQYPQRIGQLQVVYNDKQLTVELSGEAKRFIIDAAYDPVYGARPLRRFVQHTVETLVGRKIIADEVAPGAVLTVDYDGSELVVR